MSQHSNEFFIEERQNEILNYINDKEKATIEEIINVFKISKSTVRRDLIDLERRNMIIRARGGALKKKFFKYEFTLDEKKDLNTKEKIKIAKVAARYVKNGDVIFIGGGTTTFEFAKILHGIDNLMVFTNAFNILSELINDTNINIKFLGGDFRIKTLSCVGQDTINIIQNYNFDKAFIGANGVAFNEGVTTPNDLEAKIDGEVVKHSKESFLLVDYSKFGSIAYSLICRLEDIDYIITNKLPENNLDEEILSKGVNLVYE